MIDNESLSDTSSFYKKSHSTRSNSFQLSHTPNSLRLSGSENFENDHGATSVTLSMPLCPSQKSFWSTSNLLSLWLAGISWVYMFVLRCSVLSRSEDTLNFYYVLLFKWAFQVFKCEYSAMFLLNICNITHCSFTSI